MKEAVALESLSGRPRDDLRHRAKLDERDTGECPLVILFLKRRCVAGCSRPGHRSLVRTWRRPSHFLVSGWLNLGTESLASRAPSSNLRQRRPRQRHQTLCRQTADLSRRDPGRCATRYDVLANPMPSNPMYASPVAAAHHVGREVPRLVVIEDGIPPYRRREDRL